MLAIYCMCSNSIDIEFDYVGAFFFFFFFLCCGLYGRSEKIYSLNNNNNKAIERERENEKYYRESKR